ncbi:MAG: sucrose synthase [Kaiparowitsia implicata GSE-PSE-MK54-09C]|jgi:sucrose synthase|nr:sucrose synthase [Kaiparowitsia implicata GSE-PSE-MK54-09C]
MSELLQAVLEGDERGEFRQFLHHLRLSEKAYLLRNEILIAFEDYQQAHAAKHAGPTSLLNKLIACTQEMIFENDSAYFVLRFGIASEEAYCVSDELVYETVSVRDLLQLRDRIVNRSHPNEGDVLEIDFQPFYDYSPLIRDPKNIGRGVQFLNRYLSSKLFQYAQQWQRTLFQFLSLHRHDGTQLLINERIQNPQQLSDQVKRALRYVNDYPAEEPFANLRFELQSMGFEPGWGNTAGRVWETLGLLDELLDSPDPQTLEAFLSRLPMIFRIALLSVHGWFGQEGVLGRPDTGGQVVYVLDQARSLEKQLQEDLILAGLEGSGIQPKVIILTRLIPNSDGTRCNEPLEKVHGSDNAWILRVPFREFNLSMTQNWISRFEIWGYLETFVIDAEKALLAELQGRPDLILGNYSDGNLVAFLLARRLKVTHGIIAHALEKSKYLFSNLYWQDLEEQYHFSLQFTADLIAMNAADFIISSTYQEIIGTPDSPGQYESYRNFTMPELYHVVHGIELFSPKFNVVPPGVNETYFFPYTNQDDRLVDDIERLTDLLFTRDDPDQVFGKLDDPSKRPIFSMARLDRIKNMTGLVECFGKSPALQERCNLILVAGKLRTEDTTDQEEASEIEKLYRLIDEYNLHGHVRWLGVRLSKSDSAEVYRIIADHQGIFVQPALFEAFGLTVLESMITGLPTFATRFGGPLEIIQDRINGFYINPTQPEEMAEIILEFASKCDQNADYWSQISQRAIARVYSTYTWKIHTTRLLSLARIYGFWNYTTKENNEREDLLRYIETIFHLLYKPRAKALMERHATN